MISGACKMEASPIRSEDSWRTSGTRSDWALNMDAPLALIARMNSSASILTNNTFGTAGFGAPILSPALARLSAACATAFVFYRIPQNASRRPIPAAAHFKLSSHPF